jgi:hypothetical protein
MHPEPPTPPDPGLQQLLRTWRVHAPLPADFSNRVWLRLAPLDAPAGRWLADEFRRWLGYVFLRPAWSIGYALILLSAGLLAGYLGAREQTERWNRHMEQRYVQSINPYFNPR